jgi:protein-S-isoprenylcysteine O-methyltransferase Ste14
MAMTRSDAYAAGQSGLLIAFNAIFFLLPGPPLFDSVLLGRTGTILCGAGLLVLIVSLITLRRVIRVAPAPKDGGHLVSAGIYGRLRHPIYTAMVTLVVGLCLRRPGLLAIAAGAAVIAFLLVKARFEESLLLARYPEYERYRARTRGVLLTRR